MKLHGTAPTALRTPAGLAAATLLAWLAGVIGSLFLGPLSIVGAPMITGIICAATIPSRRAAVLFAGIAGAASTFVAHWGVGSGLVARQMATQPIPDVARLQVTEAFLPASSLLSVGPLAAIGAGVVGAIGAAFLASHTIQGARSRWVAHVPALVVIGLAIAGVVACTGAADADVTLNEPALPGAYGFDAAIYQQAHLLMVEQELGYYDAFLRAASGDIRLMEEGAVVDGVFQSWATAPDFIRLPYIFWVWWAADAVGLSAFRLAMFMSVVLLVGSYWALWPYFRHAAVAAPALLYPWFIAHSAWVNLYFPDFWAGMFAFAVVLLVLRRRWLAAGLFALAAALFREVAAIWMVFLIAGALFSLVDGRIRLGRRGAAVSPKDLAHQTRAAGRDLAFYLACLAVLALAVVAHRGPAGDLIAAQAVPIAITTMLVNSAARPLYPKFIAPGAWCMYAYGFGLVPAAGFSLAAPIGYFLRLQREDRRVFATVLAAALFWPAFTLIIGAPSSYWGQQYTAFGLLGSTAFLLWLTQPVGTRREDRSNPGAAVAG